MRLTLIGIGSNFGHDQLGWDAARFIAGELADHRIVETILHVTDNPAAEIPDLLANTGNAHGIGLGTTLRLLQALHALPEHWAVIGIPARLAADPASWQAQVKRLTGEILADWMESGDCPREGASS